MASPLLQLQQGKDTAPIVWTKNHMSVRQTDLFANLDRNNILYFLTLPGWCCFSPQCRKHTWKYSRILLVTWFYAVTIDRGCKRKNKTFSVTLSQGTGQRMCIVEKNGNVEERNRKKPVLWAVVIRERFRAALTHYTDSQNYSVF